MITQRVIVQIVNPVSRDVEAILSVEVETSLRNGTMTSTCDYAECYDRNGRSIDPRKYIEQRVLSMVEDCAVREIRSRQLVIYS